MPSIFNITTYPKGENTYKKTEYFKSTVGNRIVRVLAVAKYSKHFAHYVKSTYLECSGREDCPICQRNLKIRAEFPKDANKHGFIPTIQRFAVNILERTPIKTCPNTECQEPAYPNLMGKYPTACPKCGAVIATQPVHAENKVKLLTGGVELFSMLEGYNESQLDVEGNPLGIENFDINLMGTQNGDKIKVTPIPLPNQNDKVEVPEDQLYDTTTTVKKFTADEINAIEKGVAIKDIYAARNASKEAQTTENVEELKKTAENLANNLFKE